MLPDDPTRVAWGTVINDYSVLGITLTPAHPVSLEWSPTSLQAQKANQTQSHVSPQNTTTWVVTHGRNGSPTDSTIGPLADAVTVYAAKQDQQVLTVDWHQAAAAETIFGLDYGDLTEERWIPEVGAWAADALSSTTITTVGSNGGVPAGQFSIPGSDLNLIGHSWGAVVSGEIAKNTNGGVNTIVALDPCRCQDRGTCYRRGCGGCHSKPAFYLVGCGTIRCHYCSLQHGLHQVWCVFAALVGLLGQLVGVSDFRANGE